MSIIEAYNEAWENGDVDALAKIIHDDCVFNPHVGGITMSKSDILGFAVATEHHNQKTGEYSSKTTKSVWPIPSFTLLTIQTLKPSWPSCGSKTAKSSSWKPVQHRFPMITNSLDNN